VCAASLISAAEGNSYRCGPTRQGVRLPNCSSCLSGRADPHKECDSQDCAYWKEQCRPRQEPWGGPSDFPLPPDVRPRECRRLATDWKEEDFSDHKVSVVIPWLNETWEHLEGTLRSLVYFTPDELIAEYLFVSDGNVDAKEKELQAISPKVKVMALQQRQGLIRAKQWGVDEAKGPVIMFLEAHCIVNKDWLQPLLQRVKANPRVLAMPSLDVIPPREWHRYKKAAPGHWRYEWNCNVIYTNPGHLKDMDYQPHPSPGTSGGIFAIRKDWFQDMELFDPGLEEWGGDHFEISMKVWRCGGRIETVPCARVGHLFREPTLRPYDVQVPQVVRNYKRLAMVWIKDHIDIFYRMKSDCLDMVIEDVEDIRKRYDSLVDKLQCKNMSWYLENVDFELRWEMNRTCVPNLDRRLFPDLACPGRAVAGRATVDEIMPMHTFLEWRSGAGLDGAGS